MPTALSKLKPQHGALVSSAAIGALLLYRNYEAAKEKKKAQRAGEQLVINVTGNNSQKQKAAVDMVFLGRLRRLLKVVVPGLATKEVAYLLMVAFALFSRTLCDVWMIQNGTLIESAIISRNNDLFKRYLWRFIWAMPSISLINNLLKVGLNELKLRFRTRLTMYLYNKYLKGFTYYKMSNLDTRIANVDQLLTQDVEKFCDGVAELYSNLSKPVLDIMLYAVKLSSVIGAQGPAKMFLYLLISGVFLTRLRRPMGRMTVREQQLEGEFRYVNSRLITNSEEIAFYQGNEREKRTLHTSFSNLVQHLRTFIDFRFKMGLMDNIVAKYVATVVGYMVVSRPFLNLANPFFAGASHAYLLEEYYQAGRMLVRMAEAIGRVVLSGREMTRLSGYTARIVELDTVLNDLNRGKYERTQVSNSNDADSKQRAAVDLTKTGTVVTEDHVIRFENVPLVTPNGDVLVESLNFEVLSGSNVIVCGPNGCGKSSLFRILGGLWPLFGGRLTKPDPSKLFYIPQRPYMTLGTLRDQIIYPHSLRDVRQRGVVDSQLLALLERVQLSYLAERDGGWDSTQDWMDVLSGGEKQRVAMARLFYHSPQFAILDECTSAVSVDVESSMYAYCREVGITLFTVSHRKSLWKHHEFFLYMDGRGTFDFKKITDETIEYGS